MLKNKINNILKEAKFVNALNNVFPRLETRHQTLEQIAFDAVNLFSTAKKHKIENFSATIPQSLIEHTNPKIRALCARISNRAQIKEFMHDSVSFVKNAAIKRLNELGEVMPDSAPLADLSDEYYASIAQRLVNDFPDRNGDWIETAVNGLINSYRTVNGVVLDYDKLLSAVEEKLSELNLDFCDDDNDNCFNESVEHNVNDNLLTEQKSSYHIVNQILPLEVRRRLFENHETVVLDMPYRIKFNSKIGLKEQKELNTLVTSISNKLNNDVNVSWIQENTQSVILKYENK